ncbi:MAG: hypothetical protein DRJ64_10665 [Thermoprotei archaeon]|nr:MAG: hypothetical protein DRJ64_10665 [Thermoprotei archaeon]
MTAFLWMTILFSFILAVVINPDFIAFSIIYSLIVGPFIKALYDSEESDAKKAIADEAKRKYNEDPISRDILLSRYMQINLSKNGIFMKDVVELSHFEIDELIVAKTEKAQLEAVEYFKDRISNMKAEEYGDLMDKGYSNCKMKKYFEAEYLEIVATKNKKMYASQTRSCLIEKGLEDLKLNEGK